MPRKIRSIKRCCTHAFASVIFLTALTALPLQAQTRIDRRAAPPNTANTDHSNKSYTHNMAEGNGVRLHYLRAGQGDPVVLLHGWPATSYEWRHVIPLLAQRYTVIAPDNRGLGDSSRPNTGYDRRTLAQDVHALVQQLGFKQIYLVGHDLGGQIAYAYANEYPNEVRKLAIVDVPIPGLPNWEQLRPWHYAFNSVPDLPESLVAGRERTYLTWFYTQSAYNPAAFTQADIDEFVRAYSAPGAMRAGFEYYRAVPEVERQNRVYAAQTKLRMPVLYIDGSSGVGIAPFQQLRTVSNNIRGDVIERCGHWLPTECPTDLSQRLSNFFQER
jgi:pimeloyl-ACP methyl ester carboxylesterase